MSEPSREKRTWEQWASDSRNPRFHATVLSGVMIFLLLVVIPLFTPMFGRFSSEDLAKNGWSLATGVLGPLAVFFALNLQLLLRPNKDDHRVDGRAGLLAYIILCGTLGLLGLFLLIAICFKLPMETGVGKTSWIIDYWEWGQIVEKMNYGLPTCVAFILSLELWSVGARPVANEV